MYNDDLPKLYPVVETGLSDSGSLDCVLEFLIRGGGRSLPEVHMCFPKFSIFQAAMTMVPESWEKDANMSVEKKAFYNW